MGISNNNQTLSIIEAVIISINENFVEVQIEGNDQTFQWPRNMLEAKAQTHVQVGEKILLELKTHPITSIQKIVEKTKNSPEAEEHGFQIKLLESLIN